MVVNINKEIGQRLSQLVSSTGLNQKEFCQKYHFPQSSVSKWMAGINTLPLPKAYDLISAINKEGIICSIDWLCRQEVDFSQRKNQNKETQNRLKPSEVDSQEALIHEIALHKKLSSDFTFLIIPDAAMEPVFKKGDYVGGKAIYGGEIPALPESDYILETSEGFRGVRHLQFNAKKGLYECNSLKQDFPSYKILSNKLISIAKVTWHRIMSE